jgi:hypothetical protein
MSADHGCDDVKLGQIAAPAHDAHFIHVNDGRAVRGDTLGNALLDRRCSAGVVRL